MSAWTSVAIADFAKTSSGGTPNKANKANFEGGTIPWLLSGEVGVPLVSHAKNFITEAGLKGSSAKLFPPQTVLVAMYGATAGEVGILGFEAATNQAVCGILPGPKHSPKFLYYYLLLAKPTLVAQAIGNAQPNISQAKIKALKVPLPPLDAQMRIVAVLDQSFAALDRARALAEANLADAEELFESQLDAALGQAGENWSSVTLDGVCTKIGSGATPKGGGASYRSEGISLIRSLNVYDREFREDKLAFISEEQARKLNIVTVQPDDVLFNITGASIARCCVAPAHFLPARVNQHVSILRPEQSRLNSEFLCFLLTTRTMKDRLLKVGNEGGATRQAITKAQLQSLTVSFPSSIDEQDKIIDGLKRQSDQCLSLRSVYEKAIADLADLRQSILQKAFAGELT